MPTLRMDYELSQTSGAIGEPLRGCTFEVVIAGFDFVTLHCATSGLPSYTSNVVEVHHFNEKSKIAGKPDIANIDLVVNDVVQPQTAIGLWQWYQLVYDPVTGIVGYASDYKRFAQLYQYDTRGSEMRHWDCYNVWPTSYNPGTLDYTSDAPLQITVSLACDRAIMV